MIALIIIRILIFKKSYSNLSLFYNDDKWIYYLTICRWFIVNYINYDNFEMIIEIKERNLIKKYDLHVIRSKFYKKIIVCIFKDKKCIQDLIFLFRIFYY